VVVINQGHIHGRLQYKVVETSACSGAALSDQGLGVAGPVSGTDQQL